MDQSFPSEWLDLPQQIGYDKELSERFATEHEPEYVIHNKDGIRFMIRVYEDGSKEILTYDLTNHSTLRLDPTDPINPELEDLYELLQSDFLHDPPVHDIHYRGYDPTTQKIYELTKEFEYNKSTPQEFTTSAFLNVDADPQSFEEKGELLAKVKSNGTDQEVFLQKENRSDVEFTREFYENIALHKKNGEIVESYPIPELVLITNTIDKVARNKRSTVVEVNEPIKSNLVSSNL
jgi:hypothetical protein